MKTLTLILAPALLFLSAFLVMVINPVVLFGMFFIGGIVGYVNLKHLKHDAA